MGVGDARAQAERALANVIQALRALGAGPSDVVRTRLYLTDIDHWRQVGQAHAAVFGEVRPATTMVEVSRLINPDMLVEIEAEAIVEGPEASPPA